MIDDRYRWPPAIILTDGWWQMIGTDSHQLPSIETAIPITMFGGNTKQNQNFTDDRTITHTTRFYAASS